jgi:hypothetical protein
VLTLDLKSSQSRVEKMSIESSRQSWKGYADLNSVFQPVDR